MENAPSLSPDPGLTAPALSSSELDAVRARRASLRRAGQAVREVLRTPRAEGSALPLEDLRATVAALADVWDRHAADTESEDGVLAQVLADSPRLAPAIGRLRRAHGDVARDLADVRQQLAVATQVDGDTDQTVAVLSRALDTIHRHRRDGRELLYSAYHVDLGLGE